MITDMERGRPREVGDLGLTSSASKGLGRCALCQAVYIPVHPTREGATADQQVCRWCIWLAVECGHCRSGVARCVGCGRTNVPVHLVEAGALCFVCIDFVEAFA